MEVCLAYGACESPTDKAAKRISYVIGPDGRVLQAHETVDAKTHPETLLATL
jgi:peroxiredoxin